MESTFEGSRGPEGAVVSWMERMEGDNMFRKFAFYCAICNFINCEFLNLFLSMGALYYVLSTEETYVGYMLV
jgi:hypothetical protein